MDIFRKSLSIVRENRRALIWLNIGYFGVILASMLIAAGSRELQEALNQQILSAFETGPMAPVLEAYATGQILPAILLTFVINLFAGSFLVLTLPSLVFPFSGMLIGILRAFLWGVLFSPQVLDFSANQILAGILAVGLLFLEGEGYVLALFGVYIQGRALIFPAWISETSRLRAYLWGLKHTALIYILVALVLLVAAIYEVLIAVVIIPATTT